MSDDRLLDPEAIEEWASTRRERHKTGLRLPPELDERLAHLGVLMERSKNWITVKAIEAYLDQMEYALGSPPERIPRYPQDEDGRWQS